MWSAEQNISQAGKRVFHKIPAFPVMSLTKILETFIRSFPWTRCKTRTGKHGLSIKHGQGIKRGLRTGYEIRTADYFGKNDANWF